MKRLLLILLLIAGVNSNLSAEACNKVVTLDSDKTMLSDALVFLAEENGFMLTFPKNLNRRIDVSESLQLDKMIHLLTRNLNTILKYDDSSSCVDKKLVELIIVPAGDETEFITINTDFSQLNVQEYLNIEDMEAYVLGVKSGKHNADLHLMTPEQKIEFRYTKKKLQRQKRQ